MEQVTKHVPSMYEQMLINPFVEFLNSTGNHWVYGILLVGFVVAVTLRLLIYYTVSRHEWFAYEFEKRVNRFLEADQPGTKQSFYVMSKRLLEKTFYEIFETRDRMKRRKPDRMMSVGDRVFLIRQGAAWIVRDTTKQLKHLRWGEEPQFLNVTKTVFYKNPCFNKVLGIVPAASLNNVLNILPSMFVIAGIFGTFIGIMNELPELSKVDPKDVELTKGIMDSFVQNIAKSMATSVLGIALSVMMNFMNTIFSADKAFVGVIDRFENSLVLLWHRATSNEVPRGANQFDENRDAVEALAEAALNQELAKRKIDRDSTDPAVDRPKAS